MHAVKVGLVTCTRLKYATFTRCCISHSYGALISTRN